MPRFSIFCRNFFVSVPKNFVGESFSVSLISGVEKVWRRGGYQDFPSKIFCLTVPKFSVVESFTVVLISGSEKVYGQEGGGWVGVGISRFSVENFLSYSAEISVGESFTVALISGMEKVWIRGGGVSRFSVENFLSLKNFLKGPFSVSLIRVSKIFMLRRVMPRFSSFCRNFFVSVPKNFVGESFSVSLISGVEKVWRRGGYQDFPSKIFCLTVPKFP